MSDIHNIYKYAILVSFLFTVLDALIHYFFTPLYIDYYKWDFLNNHLLSYSIVKFLAVIILIAIPLYFGFQKYEYWLYSIIILLLEIRYIYDGYYSVQFHTFNIINHAITLLISVNLVKKYGGGYD